MQALKFLVAGLGILIVIGVTAIGYGLYRKSIDPGFKFFSSGDTSEGLTAPPAIIPSVPAGASATPPAPAAPVAAFGEAMIGLPTGCYIDGVSGDGARVFLRIGPNSPECSRVVVLNAATGAQIGVIRIAR